MNKRGISFLFWILLLSALAVGVAIQANNGFDLQTFKDHLTWKGVDLEGNSELINALESLINGIGEAFFYLIRWIADLASQNPQIPFKLIMFLIVLAILSPLIILLIKLITLIIIFFTEIRSRRRDRKEMVALQKAILKSLKDRKIERQSEKE